MEIWSSLELNASKNRFTSKNLGFAAMLDVMLVKNKYASNV